MFATISDFATHWMTANVIVVLGFSLLGWVIWSGSHHERWHRAWMRFRKDRLGMAALVMVGIYLLIGLLETVQFPDNKGRVKSLLDRIFVASVPKEKSYSAPMADKALSSMKPEPLQGTHVMGTDVLGRDTLVQTLKACRTALILGGLTSAIYIPIGTILGLCAGYFRRRTDDAIQYVYSTLASIPEILLLVALMTVFGKGLGWMSLALGITSWVTLCRLVRGETMRQSERTYVTAARALGQSHWQIITRHLLPNVMHLVLIYSILGFSSVVLTEATLSYLGVGSPVGTASWGTMIDSARAELSREPLVWWNIVSAATALFVLVLALNLLGDSLRRAFDPKRS
jgi:peptide/nickel transport system permease protein